MTQRSSGYNNPAFCNQYDSSLYDYEYVPEIDPDSPDLHRKGSYRVSRQMAPRWPESAVQMLNNSNSSSDGSVIIEESNNRRVTLICEKRKPQVKPDKDGGYSHDISYESDGDNEDIENIHHRYEKPRTRVPQQSNSYRNGDRKSKYIVQTHHRPSVLDDPPPYEEHVKPQREHRYAEIDEELETEGVHFSRRKPRAPSPPNFDNSPKFYANSQNFADFNESFSYRPTSSPLTDLTNSFEMSDFAPPHKEYQRQPPIGASTSRVLDEDLRHETEKDEILKRTPSNSDRIRIHPPRSSSKTPRVVSTSKGCQEDKEWQKQSVRRNISSSFNETEPKGGSPYRPTTQKLPQRSTAIITPILQRKFGDLAKGSSFQKASRMFQSTTNVRKPDSGYQVHPEKNISSDVQRMKRNQSVPNFDQHFEKRTPSKAKHDEAGLRKFEHVSPVRCKMSPVQFSPLSKSRISLLETMQTTTMDQDTEVTRSHPDGCLFLAAVLLLFSGMITCGICFYLISKLGQRYYLIFGIFAGFVTFLLGALGFRYKIWENAPNRNYPSCYLMLSGFGILNLASVILVVMAKPHPGEPFLDVCAGAICAISVIVMGLAVAGLTISCWCKPPRRDNRVASV